MRRSIPAVVDMPKAHHGLLTVGAHRLAFRPRPQMRRARAWSGGWVANPSAQPGQGSSVLPGRPLLSCWRMITSVGHRSPFLWRTLACTQMISHWAYRYNLSRCFLSSQSRIVLVCTPFLVVPSMAIYRTLMNGIRPSSFTFYTPAVSRRPASNAARTNSAPCCTATRRHVSFHPRM